MYLEFSPWSINYDKEANKLSSLANEDPRVPKPTDWAAIAEQNAAAEAQLQPDIPLRIDISLNEDMPKFPPPKVRSFWLTMRRSSVLRRQLRLLAIHWIRRLGSTQHIPHQDLSSTSRDHLVLLRNLALISAL